PDPYVLLLDEPTSGLSSGDAEKVVRTLRELADEGRTIVVTIHQPPVHVYAMFDRLAVIANGTGRRAPAPPPPPGPAIFFGPARTAPSYFQNLDASGASRGMTGADALFTAIERNPARDTPAWERAFHDSPYHRETAAKPAPAPAGPSSAVFGRKQLPSRFRQ